MDLILSKFNTFVLQARHRQKNKRAGMIIEKIKVSDLKPAPYNARQSSKEQEKQLKLSLEKFGIVEPIIFNKLTGFIVGGHFRLRELIKLGYKEVDCVIVDLNEDDEKELNIRLNANTGSWDFDRLANEWDANQLIEWGLNIPDFEPDEVPKLIDNDFVKISIEANKQAYLEMNEKLQNLCDEYNVIMKVK